MYDAVLVIVHPRVRAICFSPCGAWLEADSLWIEPSGSTFCTESTVARIASNCQTLEANAMKSTMNKVVMPLTKDLIGAVWTAVWAQV